MNDFTAAILHWYARHGRELPWRGIGDPYGIWLSEVILQQTRVEQGRAYWERFMSRFPTVEDLAAATADEVMRLWQGLGYYSRARNLHAAAQQIAQLGEFPHTIEGIKSLRGVGDYTAAAIGSMAFGLQVAAVDGNVYRVLSRHYGIDTPINTTRGKQEFSALAQSLLPTGRAGDFNQAMMDFGATQCTPSSPQCDTCPVAITCEARRSNRIAALPVKEHKVQVKQRHMTIVYVTCEGYTAIKQRGAGDIWQGLWQPVVTTDDGVPSSDKFPLSLADITTAGATLTMLAHNVKHVLTHRIIMANFYLLRCTSRPTLPEDYQWIAEGDLDRYAMPRLITRLLEMLP